MKEEKFIGAMLGTFVGDALGMPLEGWSQFRIKKELGEIKDLMEARLRKGTYTDDTEMMIGLAQSLIAHPEFDGADMASRLVENFNPDRGYGNGTIQAIRRLKLGIPWQRSGSGIFGEGSFGNGSAARIAPLGVFYWNDPEKLEEVAKLSSLITHAHPLGVEGAVIQAKAVALACRMDPRDKFSPVDFLKALEGTVTSRVFKEKIKGIEYLLKTPLETRKTVEHLGNSCQAFNSVPAAIFSFLSHPFSFKEAVLYAINLGGDTDTITAMTGAISGAYHGYSAICKEWLNELENGPRGRDYVITLAKSLYERSKHSRS